jgi:hypothetical protein
MGGSSLSDHWNMTTISRTDPLVLPRRRGRFRRPSAVTLVAWLFFLHFVLLLLSGSIFWPGGQIDLTEFRPTREPGPALVLEVVFISLGLLALVVSLGLFRLKRWAWLLAMTMEGLNLASALIAYRVGHPEYVTMVVGAFTVLALNQREVRQAFLPPEPPRA